MAITFDNAAGTGTSGIVISFGLVLTATANAVLLVFTTANAGNQTISTMNVGALAMTRLGAIDFRSADAQMRGELWGLTAPPSGVLSISAIAANSGAFAMAGLTYVGHAGTSPFGGVSTKSITATTVTIAVSSTSTNVVVCGFMPESPVGATIGAALVQRIKVNVAPCVMAGDATGSAAFTGTAIQTNPYNWGAIGINLIASASAGGATVIKFRTLLGVGH